MKYPAANVCIYCGSKEGLTDEHIIPEGLNGLMLLPKSSCKKCNHVTGATIENFVLRKMLLPARTHMKLKTKKPKNRPKSLQVAKFRDDKSFLRWEESSLEDHPFMLFMPRFAYPTELSGKEHQKDFPTVGLWTHFEDEFQKKASKWGENAGVFTQFSPDLFCRMLAKIAHSYTFAEAGFRSSKPALLPTIFGDEEFISRYVGSGLYTGVKSSNLHEISMSKVGKRTCVFIRLFASLGAPAYVVVSSLE